MAFWVVVPCELLLVAVPPDPLLLRAAAVSAGTTNVPARINAEMVAANLIVSIPALCAWILAFARMSGSGGLKSVSSPAIRRGPIVKRIVIDVSVVIIEAVVAGIGATVAPIVAVPAGPDMALAIDRSEIRRSGRNAGAAENGGRHCNRNKETFHGDNRI